MAGNTEALVVSLEARLNDFEKAFARATRTADTQFGSIERRAKQSAARLEQAFANTGNNINRMLGTIGVGLSLNELRTLADAWTDLNARVNIATGSQEKGAAVMARLQSVARRTYSSIETTTEAFVANSRALKDLGYSTQTQLDYTEALNNALVVSGAKGERAASVSDALSKAMALGSLRGDELNTVIGTGGRVAQALADSLGTTVSGLRTLGEQGKITSHALVQALVSQLAKLREEADSMPATMTDSMVILRNAFMAYIGQLNEATGAGAAFANGTIFLADNIDTAAKAAAAAAAVLLSRYVPALARVAVAQTAALATNPFALLAVAAGGAVVGLAAFGDKIKPIEGDLANLQDYAGVALDDIKDGFTEASRVASTAFLDAVNVISDALGGANISFDDIIATTKDAANTIINSFKLAYDVILITFEKLDPAVAEAILDALNGLIAGTETALNTVVQGVNAAIEAINSLGSHVGVTLDLIGNIDLGRIENTFKGAGEAAGKAYTEALQGMTRDRIGEALGNWRDKANARAAGREKTEAQQSKAAPAIDSVDTPTANPLPKEFTNQVKQVQNQIAGLQAQTEARRAVTGSLEQQQSAAEKAEVAHRLLTAAEQAGVQVTSEIKSNIEQLADAYVKASEEAKNLAKSQEEAAQKAKELESSSKDAMKGFIKDLVQGKSPAEALSNAIGKIADKLFDMGFDQLWKNIFPKDSNVFGSLSQTLFPTQTPASTAPAVTAQASQAAAALGVPSSTGSMAVTAGSVVVNGTNVTGAGLPGTTSATPSAPSLTKPATSETTKLFETNKAGEVTKVIEVPKVQAPQTPAPKIAPPQNITPQVTAPEVPPTPVPRPPMPIPQPPASNGEMSRYLTGLMPANAFDKSIPASIRTNNPGAMGFAPWQKTYGVLGRQTLNDGLGQGNNAAIFPTPEAGAAAQFDLLNRYAARGWDLRKAVDKWSGGNFSQTYANRLARVTGSDLDSPLADILKDKDKAMALAKEAAAHEAGRRFPMSDEQWETGYQLYQRQNGLTPQPMPAQPAPQPAAPVPDAAQNAIEQQRVIQEQIEAQRRLQEQMQQATTATQSMQQPLQSVTTAATSAVPNIGGMTQSVTGLAGSMMQGVPAAGQFGGAINQLVQQLMASPGGGFGGMFSGFGGLFAGFAEGGKVSGPGTATSDTIPAMLSNGEFVVNAKSARKHGALLEAINSGHVPAFAEGGFVRGGSFANSNTYAPTLNVTVSGNPQGNRLAQNIAGEVGKVLDSRRPDTFRRSSIQQAAQAQAIAQRAGARNN
jgi:tape measure domain-containing protein